jgi:hypothetical protein
VKDLERKASTNGIEQRQQYKKPLTESAKNSGSENQSEATPSGAKESTGTDKD